jgi:uncharacterized membrane protein
MNAEPTSGKTVNGTEDAGFTAAYLPGEKLIFAVIFFVGAMLRLRHLGAKSFWFDEWRMYIDARNPLAELLAGGYQQSLYPVGYLIEHFFLYLGDSPFFARLPWALIGILFIFAVYKIGRSWFGPRVALLSAMIIALNPAALLHSQDAKPYTLFCLAALVASFLLFKALATGGKRIWVAYLLTLLLLRFTHPFANYLFLAHGLYFATDIIISAKKAELGRRQALFGVAVFIGILCVSIPVISSLSGHISRAWSGRVIQGYNLNRDFSFIVTIFNYFHFGVWTRHLEKLPQLPMIIFGLLLGAGSWFALTDKKQKAARFVLLNAALPLIVGFLFIYVVLTVPRYFLFIEVFLIYISMLGIVGLIDRIAFRIGHQTIKQYLRFGLPLLFALVFACDASVWIDNYYNEGTHANSYKRDMKQVAKIVLDRYRPGDKIVGFSDNRMAFELLNWQLGDKIPKQARQYIYRPDYSLLEKPISEGKVIFVCIHDGVGGQAIVEINKAFEYFEIHKVLTSHVLVFDPELPTVESLVRSTEVLRIKHIGEEPIEFRGWEIDFIGKQITSNEIVHGRRTYPMTDGARLHYLMAIHHDGKCELTLNGFAPEKVKVRFLVGFDGVEKSSEKELTVDGATEVSLTVDLKKGFRKLNLELQAVNETTGPDQRLFYLDTVRID